MAVMRIRPKVSEAVDGGSGTQAHQDRREEVLRWALGDAGVDLGPDMSDRYSPGRMVSIEGEGERQKEMQEKLDRQVEDENKFPEDPEHVTERGRPPCLRVRGEGNGRPSGWRR